MTSHYLSFQVVKSALPSPIPPTSQHETEHRTSSRKTQKQLKKICLQILQEIEQVKSRNLSQQCESKFRLSVLLLLALKRYEASLAPRIS